ncbi:MAG: isoprenylcysteine carboxylmethyltransferase family protein [Planctomycetes bacterium]|nr:isoprenylcysteine carboxylmethyltransferase family protein [Planctomycetota bacterium]
MKRTLHLSTAIAWGFVCHGVFALAIVAMFLGVRSGMEFGFGTLHGPFALVANAALVLQFPLLHSFLLGTRGRKVLESCAPRAIARELAPTVFATVAGLPVLLTFIAWSPSGSVLARPTGAAAWLCDAFYVGAWLLLVRSIHDAGVANQTGFVGWSSVVRRKPLDFGPFPTHGLFRLCRQPVYFAYSVMLWAAPVRTPDGLWLAAGWSAYCLIGPLLKERRYLRWFGEAYETYRRRTPYFVPRIRS